MRNAPPSANDVDRRHLPLMSRDNLVAAGRNPSVPFAVELDDGSTLAFVELLRVLPERRMVGKAIWQGQEVLAKLYISPSAAKEVVREIDGLRALVEAHVPTPQLREIRQTKDGVQILLTEYLDHARTLADHVARELALVSARADLPRCIRDVLSLIGKLHRGQLVHTDLHPGNFLEQDGTWFLIDGDAVSKIPRNRIEAATKENLALFLAQFTPTTVPFLAHVIPPYVTAYPGQALSAEELSALVELARGTRLRRFLRKTGRDCSKFKVTRRANQFASVLRAAGAWLAAAVTDPGSALESGKRLKSGRTATVALLVVGPHEVVVKQYNIKSLLHGLSRSLRPSRAWHAWIEGHRLQFLGIHTATPLAVVERRIGPLRREAWLFTDFVAGVNLRDLFSGREAETPNPVEAMAIKQTFEGLQRHRITHGDLKATNLIFNDERLLLIDLDATVQHNSDGAYLKAWRRDRERFLRNWPADSALALFFDNLLPPVDTLPARLSPPG